MKRFRGRRRRFKNVSGRFGESQGGVKRFLAASKRFEEVAASFWEVLEVSRRFEHVAGGLRFEAVSKRIEENWENS